MPESGLQTRGEPGGSLSGGRVVLNPGSHVGLPCLHSGIRVGLQFHHSFLPKGFANEHRLVSPAICPRICTRPLVWALASVGVISLSTSSLFFWKLLGSQGPRLSLCLSFSFCQEGGLGEDEVPASLAFSFPGWGTDSESEILGREAKLGAVQQGGEKVGS